MNQSDAPARFPIPFASGAGSSFVRPIPQAHQAASSTDAPASLFDGFPPETFLPLSAGGIPPNGQDVNGLLNQVTAALRWFQAGGTATFDATFAASIGGYPRGAVLASTVTSRYDFTAHDARDGLQFISVVDGNMANPDAGPSPKWLAAVAPSLTYDTAGNWRRSGNDGFLEMGGVAPIYGAREGAFALAFPFSGFPNSCIGISATVINSASSNVGSTSIQEVSLTKTGAQLYAQNSQYNTISDASGGMRWRAWGV